LTACARLVDSSSRKDAAAFDARERDDRVGTGDGSRPLDLGTQETFVIDSSQDHASSDQDHGVSDHMRTIDVERDLLGVEASTPDSTAADAVSLDRHCLPLALTPAPITVNLATLGQSYTYHKGTHWQALDEIAEWTYPDCAAATFEQLVMLALRAADTPNAVQHRLLMLRFTQGTVYTAADLMFQEELALFTTVGTALGNSFTEVWMWAAPLSYNFCEEIGYFWVAHYAQANRLVLMFTRTGYCT
jgi:hypothetical protein